jgi:hypothetical protein
VVRRGGVGFLWGAGPSRARARTSVAEQASGLFSAGQAQVREFTSYYGADFGVLG